MGASASITNIKTLSPEDVANLVRSKGSAYEGYAAAFLSNGIDGLYLSSLTTEPRINELLGDGGINVTNPLHRKILCSSLLGLLSAKADDPLTAPCGAAAPSAIQGVALIDHVSRSPRALMKDIFKLQGVYLDPSDTEAALSKLEHEIGTGYGDGETKYDCFINYRVASEKKLALEVYLSLKVKGIHAYLDQKCLKAGMDWEKGFLDGLSKSKYFIPLISRAGLERARDASADHSHDNVLLEYEMALNIAKATGNEKYICPVLVGEVRADRSVLRFEDMNAMLYPDSVLPIAPQEPVSVPAVMPMSMEPMVNAADLWAAYDAQPKTNAADLWGASTTPAPTATAEPAAVDVNSFGFLRAIDEHKKWIVDIKCLDAVTIIAADASGMIIVIETRSSEVLASWQAHDKGTYSKMFFNSLALLRQGSKEVSLVTCGSDDLTVKHWNPWTGELIGQVDNCHDAEDPSNRGVHCVCALAYPQFATGGGDGKICIWDITTGKRVLAFSAGTRNHILVLTLLQNGHLASSGNFDCTVRVWDINKGKCLQAMKGHTNAVQVLIELGNGYLVSSAGYDNDKQYIRTWDPVSGTCIRTLDGHTDGVCGLQVLADGVTMVSGSSDKTIKFWNTDSGQCLRTIEVEGQVATVCLFPDKTSFATGSGDPNHDIKLWG